MRFAHLSDFHYTTVAGNYPTLRPGLVDALSLLVNDIGDIQSHLDFVSITGDLVEAGDAESYLALAKLLSILDIPVLVVPGNHDSRASFRHAFSSPYGQANSETLDHHTTFGHLQVLGLDTLIEGEVGGRLTGDQVAWLEKLLANDQVSHTVIAMHHPPFPIGSVEFDAIAALEGREQFAQVVAQAKSDVVILSGHIHRPYQAVWNGASCYIAGSPSSQMGSQFCFGDSPLHVVEEPYVYFIHDIDEKAGHRVGFRYVKLD